MLIDTHAHLTDNRFKDDLPAVLTRAKAAGVETIINVGYDLASSQQALSLAAKSSRMFATAGIHPHEAAKTTDESFLELRRLAKDNRVVAIGEIGLDYYYNHAPREDQHHVLRKQLQLAQELGLPVILHDREAHRDVLTILQEESATHGVMHCFSGDVNFAEECLTLGLHISLAGPVTFKNAKDLAEVAQFVPLDRLLLETDSPYLAPVPHRGKRNEPAHVRVVAEKVAQLRNIDVSLLAEQTTNNAIRLFKLVNQGE